MGFFPASTLLGLVLIVASMSLFILSKVKPNLFEESDYIYVAVGVICAIFLLASTDLSAAMAMQQFLLLPATISLMWQFVKLRSENKQLKNRQSGTESPKAYNARLEDDYSDTPRERRQGKRRRNIGYEEEDARTESLRERRLLGDSREIEAEPMLSRRRGRSFDAEDTRVDRYDDRRDANVSNRRADWDDETDWDDTPSPRTARRALPDADRPSTRSERRPRRRDDLPSEELEPRESRRRDEPIATNEPDVSPRRRPRPPRERDGYSDRSDRPKDVEGTMASYVDYEPIGDPNDRPSEPPSGLPPSGSEPIVFPDRY
jgi:hypothetical protein